MVSTKNRIILPIDKEEGVIMSDYDVDKRHTLKVICIGAASIIMYSNKVASIVVNRSIPATGSIGTNRRLSKAPHILFGENPSSCSIIPGNTNKHLIEANDFRMSDYVATAYTEAKSEMKRILGTEKEILIDLNDERIESSRYDNMLILGGPVANIYTQHICGYEMITPKNSSKQLPQLTGSSPLPFGFYCGNDNGWGYWGDEERTVFRLLDTGVEKKTPLYGIVLRDSNEIISPPVKDGKLVADMLMIIRIPNFKEKGKLGHTTIIGGMHGYSLKSFFDKNNLYNNMNELTARIGDVDFFQALVPAKLNPSNGEATIDWNGWGNWKFRAERLDPKAFLSLPAVKS
jgi:hypothetical protein